jgi:hypothetical protein
MKLLASLASSVVCFVLAGLGPFAQPGGQANANLQKVVNLQELRSLDPVQRARAAEFPLQGDPLIDVKAITVVAEPEEPPILLPGATPPTPDEVLGDLVCGTPVVLLGSILSAKAYLNLSETFLYTDHGVLVERWIRPSSRLPQITVSAGGGRVQVGQALLDARTGHRYEVGERYVMFLREIPRGQAYRPIHYPFLVAKGFALPSPRSLVGRMKHTPEDTLLNQLAEFSSKCKGHS